MQIVQTKDRYYVRRWEFLLGWQYLTECKQYWFNLSSSSVTGWNTLEEAEKAAESVKIKVIKRGL